MGIMDLFMQVTQSDIKWFVTHCLERIFIFLWRIYLLQSLESVYFFSLCKLYLASFSLLLLNLSNIEIDLHSHLPFKQPRLQSRASPRGMTHGSALL